MIRQPTIFSKGLIARLGLKSYPLSLTYELSWRCNLSCSYCDRHTPMKQELGRDEIFKALGAFYELGMRITNLDGGEALLHRNIDEIVEWLTQKGVTVTMHTNGMLIPNKIETVRKLSAVKISLDGPRENHDGMRGAGSYDKALAGAEAAKAEGVDVAFTCTVGSHNIDTIETLIQMAEGLNIPVIFQPAMNSLFLETDRDGSSWQPDAQIIRDAFTRIEQLKWRGSKAVGNAWSSLRHFRTFPENTKPPCAAGWVMATMDPEGALFPCGQVNRSDRSNVARLGAAAAFAKLNRDGCSQCWCARLVEGNYQWGMRVDKMLRPLNEPQLSKSKLQVLEPELDQDEISV